MQAAVQTTATAIGNWRIGFIVASALLCSGGMLAAPFDAGEPPPDLAKRVAQRESETQAEESNYTSRQSITVEEFNPNGAVSGQYREVRDVIFSPGGQRTEQMVEKPRSTLSRMKLTEEDFRDIREIQPFLLTADRVRWYEVKFRGDEDTDGHACWVLGVQPRQILSGQRLFEGTLWVDKGDYSIVRSEGQAVPQIRTTSTENLFPHFTTLREPVNGYWFPVTTYADDTLYFRNGPLRTRMVIRYSNYKKFRTDSTVVFEK